MCKLSLVKLIPILPRNASTGVSVNTLIDIITQTHIDNDQVFLANVPLSVELRGCTQGDKTGDTSDVVILGNWKNGGSQRASVALLSLLATRRKNSTEDSSPQRAFRNIEQTTISSEMGSIVRESQGELARTEIPIWGKKLLSRHFDVHDEEKMDLQVDTAIIVVESSIEESPISLSLVLSVSDRSTIVTTEALRA
ncbi:hypothetical protein N7494_008199 [Penicillium frequentans]|uniref:Uncharacterized protein n=1 Tax=Penicillium frequentans TaxID=3151616 RepID=A0AAD6GE65_9EURO|nr:hypothetical protein N7494_008199 [Penicillium glabrum]